MDFTFDEQQQAVVDLAHQIFTDALAPDLQTERLRVVEASDDWFDRDLWQVLADAGLLGIALGTDVGGAGLDAVALALLSSTKRMEFSRSPSARRTALRRFSKSPR